MSDLKGFDFAEFLKRHTWIGQIDPWRRHDDGTPLLCLLTSVEDALSECKHWSGQDITRGELVNHLQENRVLVLRSPEHMQKVKEEQHKKDKLEPKPKKTRASHKKELTPERKEQLRQQMIELNANKPLIP